MQSSEAFHAHDEQFQAILGSTPSLELLLEKDYPFAHEAGIYIAATRELFITSNKCTNADGTPNIKITRVNLSNNSVTADEITPDIPMGNGGVNWGTDALICGQGTLDRPSGLYSMSVEAPYSSSLVIGDFLGRPFNSVNDVVVHSDGSIWFTDPTYGFEQGYRPNPALPSQVYRFKPGNGSIRAVADGFGHPNGICFSPDEKTVYITDTDKQNGDGTIDHRKASAMYDLLWNFVLLMGGLTLCAILLVMHSTCLFIMANRSLLIAGYLPRRTQGSLTALNVTLMVMFIVDVVMGFMFGLRVVCSWEGFG